MTKMSKKFLSDEANKLFIARTKVNTVISSMTDFLIGSEKMELKTIAKKLDNIHNSVLARIDYKYPPRKNETKT